MRPGRRPAGTVPIKGPGTPAKGPALGPMPDSPWTMTGDAKAEWERFAPILHADGRLTPATAPALALYCQAYARGKAAAKDLADNTATVITDSGACKANPAASVLKEATATMLKVLSSFGATPADAARIKLVEAAAPDALTELLNRRKARS